MKKLLLILAFCIVTFTSFAGKIVVVEVNKSGSTWHNLFNCYGDVTTSIQRIENDITYVTVSCTGSGFNFCRASRQVGTIGSINSSSILGNAGIIDAINTLIEASETSTKKGTNRGTATKKVAIRNQGKTELYFVKASWNYNSQNPSQGRMTITIETDDNSLINDCRN